MSNRTIAIARATGVIGATVALVTGITFASFTSTATLSDNTIASATAGLTVSNGGGFASSVQGFNFTGLIPGQWSDPFLFDLQTSGVPLAVTAHVPVTPTFTGFLPGGFSGVRVVIKTTDDTIVADTTLADLLAGEVPLTGTLSPMAGNSTSNLKAFVNIDPSVVTGSQATVDGFNLDFTGTQPTT